MQSNKIYDFLTGKENDDGRTWLDIIKMTDSELESCHNVIQWLFPLPEPSKFHPDAPLLTKNELNILLQYYKFDYIKNKMKESFNRFKRFLVDSVIPSLNWESPKSNENKYNHNWLRVTRAIRSLRWFGCVDEARNLFNMMEFIGGHFALDESMQYWREAMESPLIWPSQNVSPSTEGN